LSQEQQRRRKV